MPAIVTDIQPCAAALRQGRPVARPPETVYGLAAVATSLPAVRRVFEIKQRPLFDPLIVHVAGLDQLPAVVRHWPPLAQRLAERFWPGPMTLVLAKSPDIDPLVTAGLDTVGVRMPRHDLALALIRAAGPLAAPSANRFGRTSPTTAQHVAHEFADEPDLLILDGGPCDVGVESTVIALQDSAADDFDAPAPAAAPAHDTLTILRPGLVTREMLEDALKDWPRPVAILRAESSASPGHLPQHYRPAIPLVLIETAEQSSATESSARASSTPTALPRKLIHRAAAALNLPPNARCAELRLNDNPIIAARTLYADMRALAATGATSGGGAHFIAVQLPDSRRGQAWDAIRDRLERAASARITA